MLFSCTNTRPLNPRMNNATQVQTLTGKSPLLNGLPFSIVLTRANRLDKLHVIMAYRMRRLGVLFVQQSMLEVIIWTLLWNVDMVNHVFGALRYDNFFSTYNFLTVISYNTTFGLIALGMTFVMMTGGIDLSVGSLAALCSVVAALASPYGLLAAIGAAALTGLIVGLFNGWVIAWLRIPPFLATLAMLLAARGMALVLAKDATVSVNATSDWAGLSLGILFGIPLLVFLFLAYAIGSIVLNFTRFGRHVLAIGGNEEAARLMGLSVERIKLAVYAIRMQGFTAFFSDISFLAD